MRETGGVLEHRHTKKHTKEVKTSNDGGRGRSKKWYGLKLEGVGDWDRIAF
jgi:hypothetical protein